VVNGKNTIDTREVRVEFARIEAGQTEAEVQSFSSRSSRGGRPKAGLPGKISANRKTCDRSVSDAYTSSRFVGYIEKGPNPPILLIPKTGSRPPA
jgi:hypothetical protein